MGLNSESHDVTRQFHYPSPINSTPSHLLHQTFTDTGEPGLRGHTIAQICMRWGLFKKTKEQVK